jgi:hypothetical protein
MSSSHPPRQQRFSLGQQRIGGIGLTGRHRAS